MPDLLRRNCRTLLKLPSLKKHQKKPESERRFERTSNRKQLLLLLKTTADRPKRPELRMQRLPALPHWQRPPFPAEASGSCLQGPKMQVQERLKNRIESREQFLLTDRKNPRPLEFLTYPGR